MIKDVLCLLCADTPYEAGMPIINTSVNHLYSLQAGKDNIAPSDVKQGLFIRKEKKL